MKALSVFSKLLHPNMLARFAVYARLMRLDRPIGTLLLLWPTLWAVWLASDGRPDFTVLAAFAAGTFLMRSAGCVVNDWADRDIDGHVARTASRPAAQGLVSKSEVVKLTLVLCGLAALCLIPFDFKTWLLAVPALFLAFTYPYTKRFFPVPQLYLGLAFSFGIPMVFMATLGEIPALAWWLFAANVFWTLAYDTIYAIADKADDLKLSVQTSAITLGRFDAEGAMLCYAIFDLLMMQVGLMINAVWLYWLMLVAVVCWQWRFYLNIQTREPQACFDTFLQNNKIGLLWFLGIVMHYAYI
ncbi:4-hydroxybenzoate octaprenyltransferase [Conchiformibius steedae]|uniref:4-hydroxybenzoate octaprenyltransferase n=1 Tax=Conchiformibius steedae TaxID=153493 RepID=A0A3P2A8A4_9NEIS|nr:4-hydroxybenzoate octaprenyltransferase [Conchiformibius steedae]RRD91188.1 4-hydroxybenzoate octaprenyltransferase [Conchiformibius steedae]